MLDGYEEIRERNRLERRKRWRKQMQLSVQQKDVDALDELVQLEKDEQGSWDRVISRYVCRSSVVLKLIHRELKAKKDAADGKERVAKAVASVMPKTTRKRKAAAGGASQT